MLKLKHPPHLILRPVMASPKPHPVRERIKNLPPGRNPSRTLSLTRQSETALKSWLMSRRSLTLPPLPTLIAPHPPQCLLLKRPHPNPLLLRLPVVDLTQEYYRSDTQI